MKAESVDPGEGKGAGLASREIRTCPACGTKFSATGDSGLCPVCVLLGAAGDDSATAEAPNSVVGAEGGSAETEPVSIVRRFENYEVMLDQDGKPIELGRGAMGITYKAFDIDLRFPVTLKVISEKYVGDESARLRFLREARAAAKVRHPNVASVFHLGRSSGEYFYAMEFVEGETLESLIRRSGRLEVKLALEITSQIAAGLEAVHEQKLVHRDIKPTNIMLRLKDDGRLTAKIIDLGLAKGASEPDSQSGISTPGAFAGTPAFASPEQFAGLSLDIRSDLYSLRVTFWEMLAGRVPFHGSPTEVMYQHQHGPLPLEQLKGLPQPVVALLEVLLGKDPAQRIQGSAELLQAIQLVTGAIDTGRSVTPLKLRAISGQRPTAFQKTGKFSKRVKALFTSSRVRLFAWLMASLLIAGVVILAVNALLGVRRVATQSSVTPSASVRPPEKSIAVLPFESLSENKGDIYFADGVQDEILNNLAKIAQLKVISRTSVMQYRPDNKRDLRQIAKALGVSNVLEGTVRREGNHVRVSTELVDARDDNMIWADSYDRDLTDIFAIQSEVAQTIVRKLNATLSPEEKRSIEAKPTDNLEAYDLYLRANELIMDANASWGFNDIERPLREAIGFLERAVQLDPKFTLAYCASGLAHDLLYFFPDATPERRALADAAINSALRLRPDLPEVHLAYAYHLYYGYHDYEQARAQLAIAKRGLPNDVEAIALQSYIDCRQGNFEKAIQELREAITLDPRNKVSLQALADTFYYIRQFSAAEQIYDRLQEIPPDQPGLRIARGADMLDKTGDITALRSAVAALPKSMADGPDGLPWRLLVAVNDRNWAQAKEIIEKIKGGEVAGLFAYGWWPVPVGCYSILIARLHGEPTGANPSFAEVREQMNQKIQKSPENENAAPLLSQLAVVDALLNNKEAAVSEAKRAVEMLPISKDALQGPGILINLAVVYAWTNEPDVAFTTLDSLKKTPRGIYYGALKLDPLWDPLRKDSRFDKLLAELAPRD